MRSAMRLPIFCGKRLEVANVPVRNDAESMAAANQLEKRALVVVLTWAKLYTKAMHKDLGAISTVVRKRQLNVAGPKMKKSADKLRDQLQRAHRTVGDLSDHAGIASSPVKR
jgi:hypothetical protein